MATSLSRLPLVLIIDDSEVIRRAVAALLSTEPVVVHEAASADAGLAEAQALPPDLVLLDIGMQGIGGLETCRRLKADPRTRDVPVIFVTGHADVATKVAGFELGAVDYVTKPFEPNELRARVRAALRTKRYLDLLAMRAQVDGLTGAWNRAYFDRRLEEEVAASRRYGRRVALLMIDIDLFKTVNDRYGHPFGDLVLQSVADVLHRTLRETDAACRYGGEEFAVVLTEEDLAGATRAAERIRQAVAALAIPREDGPVSVTVSIGAACLGAPGPEVTPRLVVETADEALYRAKREGRNRVCVAPPFGGGPAAG